MQKREYKNNEMISIVGFGGIIVSRETQKDANNYIAEAIDKGINYFDVAPTYGNAQDRMGPGLKGKRNDVFLACKTTQRKAKEAKEELHDSLKKLKTDRFDLYQLHGLNSVEEAKTILGPGGALETFVKAREKGYVRYLGVTAHSEEAAILLMEEFDFDSVLFPINWVCLLNNGYGNKIMKTATKNNVTRLSLKSMALTVRPEDYEQYPKAWYRPVEDKELAKLAMRYTLSQDITAAVTPGDIEHMRWAAEVGNDYKPVTDEEIEYLKKQSKGVTPIFPK